MYFNGSYTLKRAGASVMLIPSEGDILMYAIQLEFLAINNIAEYEGLVTGLQLAKEYDCNNDKMTNYLAEVRRLEKFFDEFEVRYVPLQDNCDADDLVWIASSRVPTPTDVIIEKLSKHLVRPAEEDIDAAKLDLMVINEPEQEPLWPEQTPSYHANPLQPIDLS
jgi:hypothetical protein